MVKVTVAMTEERRDPHTGFYDQVQHKIQTEGKTLTKALNEAQAQHPTWILSGYTSETKGYRG